uniref:Uncharacterized protein n=1 Tax=viral metagenome TaxID=1070528 RepID=A0A6M3LTU3_9ZZZZ
MRRSNEELWDDAIPEGALRSWGAWSITAREAIAAYTAAVRADEAEHAKEEQREACALAYAARLRYQCFKAPTDAENDLIRAILNAGAAPALKPGMLVCMSTRELHILRWDDEMVNPEMYRPLTRAECMAYADKAPV